MVVKTESKVFCDQCGIEIPVGSNQSIRIGESTIHGSKGARTLNGDFCGKSCFLREIEEAGCY